MPLSDGGKCHHGGWGRRDGRPGLKAACLPHWLRAFSKKLAHRPKLQAPVVLPHPANPSLLAVRGMSQLLQTAWDMPPCSASSALHSGCESHLDLLRHYSPLPIALTQTPPTPGQQGAVTPPCTHAQRAQSLSQSFACHSPKNGTCSDAYSRKYLGVLARLSRPRPPHPVLTSPATCACTYFPSAIDDSHQHRGLSRRNISSQRTSQLQRCGSCPRRKQAGLR